MPQSGRPGQREKEAVWNIHVETPFKGLNNSLFVNFHDWLCEGKKTPF